MYRKIRMFDSDIHIFEYHPSKNPSQISLGTIGKREKLSSIDHSWYKKNGYKEVASINLGFFDIKSEVEHYGWLFRDSGFNSGRPHRVNGVECYLMKNGKFVIDDLLPEEVDILVMSKSISWGASLSYALIIDGKENLLNSQHYYHSSSRHPRTLIGQKADGTMIIAVADGRSNLNKGLNAKHSAQLMLELGCINAVNADGGGSSTMTIEDKVVNNPSDGVERRIGSALLVFEKEKEKPMSTPEKTKKLIALDDGHGMKTAGKRTPYVPSLGRFVHENEFNKAVVNYLKEELERSGFDTLLVAPTDEDTPLADRVNLANSKKADIYVSVHYNAMDGKFDGANKDPEGIEIYNYPGSTTGRKLAESVMNYLKKGTVQKIRGLKEANFYVLKYTTMPAILTENGFMDNEREAELMVNPEFQKEVAVEHAMGICDYFNIQYIPEDKKLFKDIDSNHWAYDAIEELIEKDIITGFSDNTFKPDEQITRAQSAVWIRRLLKYFEGKVN